MKCLVGRTSRPAVDRLVNLLSMKDCANCTGPNYPEIPDSSQGREPTTADPAAFPAISRRRKSRTFVQAPSVGLRLVARQCVDVRLPLPLKGRDGFVGSVDLFLLFGGEVD